MHTPSFRRRLLAAVVSLAVAAAPLLSGCGAQNGGGDPVSAAPAATASPATPEPAYADRREKAPEYDKEETVYAKADASGEVRSVTVECVLHYGGEAGVVEDVSDLEDIKNSEGDEEFTQERDGALFWEDHGEKIRYEGTSSRELPVTVSISYELDGKAVSPEQLAGRSGHLRMRFDYQNNSATTVTGVRSGSKEETETCVPFLALTVVMLPEETFSSVEATSGRLLRMGDQSVFIGYALPGLTEYLRLQDYKLTKELDIPLYAEFEADVEDFSLDFTSTIVSNRLLDELKDADLNDLDDFAVSTDDLSAALSKLATGARKLATGAASLQDGLSQYADGVAGVSDGAKGLSDALNGMRDQFSGAQADMNELLASLSASNSPSDLSSLLAALNELTSALSAFQAQLDSAESYPALVGGKVAGAQSALSSASSGIASLLADPDLTEAQKQALSSVSSGIQSAQNELSGISGLSSDAFASGIESLSAAADKLSRQAAAAKATPEQLQQLQALLSETSALCAGVSSLAQSASALAEGAAALNESGAGIRESSEAFTEALKSLSSGVSKFRNAGVSELSELGGWRLRSLLTQLRAMRLADEGFDSFSGRAEGRTGTVRFIIETDAIE